MFPYLLVLVGLVLIFIEFFVPGGVLGIGGAILIIFGIVFFAMTTKSFLPILFFSLSTLLLVLIVIRLTLWIMKKPKRDSTFYLHTDQEGYSASSFSKELIGKTGKALTDLRPSGHILIEGKRYQAVSQAGYIEQNSEIKVVGGEGGHLIVQQTRERME
jgi:membrane-bound ClpP family serine protease